MTTAEPRQVDIEGVISAFYDLASPLELEVSSRLADSILNGNQPEQTVIDGLACYLDTVNQGVKALRRMHSMETQDRIPPLRAVVENRI